MKDLIDVRGASGASYRFRRAPAGAGLPGMSGNFLYVRPDGEGFEIVASGTADGLSQARDGWALAARDHGAEELFVRLNLSRRVRLGEHADIVALHKPPLLLAEQGEVRATETDGV